LSALAAEESLSNVAEMAYAFGTMDEQNQRRQLQRWQRLAEAGGVRNKWKPDEKARRAALATMGIVVDDRRTKKD